MLGMPRYRDDYFPFGEIKDKPAVWFMGLPLEASVFLRKALEVAQNGRGRYADILAAKGLFKLGQAVDVFNSYGFLPELLIYKDGEYQLPSQEHRNDLVWNHAEMIHAAALGLKAQVALGIKS
jgi:hypothetical protein